jgi:anti-sigma factor ChrR (cupin superfamily)
VKLSQALVLVASDLATKAETLTWTPFRPGVERHLIYDVGDDGPSAALLRYAPGSSVPPHQHTGYEHILVLAGAQEDERGRYAAGTVVINPPGTGHHVRSPEGCLVLAIWNRPVRFVDPGA